MEMKIEPGKTVKDPTVEQITEALQQVYDGLVTAVILVIDSENQHFIQAAGIGRVEYKEDNSGIMYAANDVPLEKCTEVFLQYAAKERQWKNALPWEAFDYKIQPQGSFDAIAPETAPVLEPPKRLKTIGILLSVILGILLPCCACGEFTTLLQNWEPIQRNLLYGELILNIVWISLAGIGYAIFQTQKLWYRFQIYIFFSLLLLVITLEVWLSISLLGLGIFGVALFSAIILGALSIWGLVKGLRLTMEFERDSVEVPVDYLSFQHESDASEYASMAPVLLYGFLKQYSGLTRLTLKKEKAYKSAMKEKRLHMFVRYLPRNPKIHLTRIEV
jgi:hypothetical protein